MRAWTTQEAIALCGLIEDRCPKFGCHVALTGGLLYKEGPRTDCDLLFYRIREVEAIDIEGLLEDLKAIGVIKASGFGWCYKAAFDGRRIDFFFPEEESGKYEPEDADSAALGREEVAKLF